MNMNSPISQTRLVENPGQKDRFPGLFYREYPIKFPIVQGSQGFSYLLNVLLKFAGSCLLNEWLAAQPPFCQRNGLQIDLKSTKKHSSNQKIIWKKNDKLQLFFTKKTKKSREIITPKTEMAKFLEELCKPIFYQVNNLHLIRSNSGLV